MAPDDWYRISFTEVTENMGGEGLMKYWPHVLEELEPDFNWEWHRFERLNKKHKQRNLVHLCESWLAHNKGTR